VFLINRGEIIERFDAIYYSASNSLKIANETAYPIKKLSDIAILQRGRFSHRPRNDERFYHGNYPFIQTGDIVRASENNDTILFTQTLNELGLSVSKLFQANTLIITIAANIGDTAILTYPACFPDSLVTITPKNEWVDVRYLNVYFKYVKDYLVNLAPQAAQKNINLQQLSPTPIVIPPKEIQTEIISIFETAYNAKKQKETQAANLLASIDGYLLNELGITLPPLSDKKTYFMSNSRQVSGGRFDPKKYTPENEQLITSLSDGKYKAVTLKNLIVQSVSGDWGIDESRDGFVEALVIRSTEFDNLFNLNLDNNRVKYRFINETKLEKINLQVNDLLIEKSGGSENQAVGRIAIITQELADNYSLSFSNFIHKIRVDKTRINADYLFVLLKMIHSIKITDLMQSQTNGIRNLIMREYFNIQAPLPPLEKQTEIADHIRAIRAKAKQLQHEAKAELEQAKSVIEKMILG